MSREALKAQVKAAAWGLVALIGVNEAVRVLQSVIAELTNSQWEGPESR